MHEFSVARALIETASREAERAGAGRVLRLVCRVGVLRQIEDALLREAFEIAREGTRCREAALAIEKIPMRLTCPRCGRRFAVQDWCWRCPSCRVEGTAPTGGDALELVSIEAEVDHEDRSPEECVGAERARRA